MSQTIILSSINTLDSRIRRIGRTLAIAWLFVDAHYFKRDIAHLHMFAYQLLEVLGLQLLSLLIGQYQHLAFFLQVDLVDETSTNQVALYNTTMNGMNTYDLHIHVLLAIGYSS